jgi:pheromone shutdown protein TraB
MSTFSKLWKTLPMKNGVIMFGALVAYFLIMRAFGFAGSHWLRVLNVFIVFALIRSAIRTYMSHSGASYYEDFADFFWIGVRTSLFGIGLFSAFIAIYLDKLDPEFMAQLAVQESFGGMITPVAAGVIVFIEGMSSALICTFAYIQLVKSKTVQQPVRNNSTL